MNQSMVMAKPCRWVMTIYTTNDVYLNRFHDDRHDEIQRSTCWNRIDKRWCVKRRWIEIFYGSPDSRIKKMLQSFVRSDVCLCPSGCVVLYAQDRCQPTKLNGHIISIFQKQAKLFWNSLVLTDQVGQNQFSVFGTMENALQDAGSVNGYHLYFADRNSKVCYAILDPRSIFSSTSKVRNLLPNSKLISRPGLGHQRLSRVREQHFLSMGGLRWFGWIYLVEISWASHVRLAQ